MTATSIMNIAGCFGYYDDGTLLISDVKYHGRNYAQGKDRGDGILELKPSDFTQDGLFSDSELAYDMMCAEIEDELKTTFNFFTQSDLKKPYWLLLSHTLPLIELIGCIRRIVSNTGQSAASIINQSKTNFEEGIKRIPFRKIRNQNNNSWNDTYTAIYQGVRCGLFHTASIKLPKNLSAAIPSDAPDIRIITGDSDDYAIVVTGGPDDTLITICADAFAETVRLDVIGYLNSKFNIQPNTAFLDAVLEIWKLRWGKH